MTHKYYDILGVTKSSSKEEIKVAYKKLAMKNHPDKGGDPDKFKEISEAYQALSDDEKRSRYDQLGDDGYSQAGGGGQDFDPNSIFEQFFGGGGGMGGFHPFFGGGARRAPARRKCRSVQHVIQVSNKDAYYGGNKVMKISLHKKCFKCLKECKNCQGSGAVNSMQRMGPFTTMVTNPCHICEGSGKIPQPNKECESCKGKCEYTEEKIIDIQIPRGVSMGHQVKFDGFGEQAQNEEDIPGDLIFEVFVQPDPIFERNNLDLIYKNKISFKESLVGKMITIPQYDQDIQMDVSEFGVIQPNYDYIIPGKGMKSGSKVGNLLVRFTIDYPVKHLTEDVKNTLKEIL